MPPLSTYVFRLKVMIRKSLVRISPEGIKRYVLFLKNVYYSAFYSEASVPICIYQMGKVGSNTVALSLSKYKYHGVVVNAHTFSVDNDKIIIRKLYRGAIDNKMPLKVISFVREPLGRNISAFFHNIHDYYQGDINAADPAELKMIFLSQYDHDLPLEWFDKQIYANFGIDVFKKPFPKDGVCCYSKDNIELLVIRLEANQDTKLGALREFLDLEDQFQLYNANVGSSKNYAKGYQRFRSEVTFEAAFLDKMYNNKYCRYFYGKDAIRSARNKWSEVERKVAE